MLARRPLVLVLVDLVQDLDVLLPVLRALARSPDLRLRTVVSRWLLAEAPRVAAVLAAERIPFRTVRRASVKAGRAPALLDVCAVLLASDSGATAHAAGRALALRARQAGLATFALQHGVELPSAGSEGGVTSSGVLFCWGPHAEAQALAAGARPVVSGRPWIPPSDSPQYDVGVFENLHDPRYTDRDRDRFVANLQALAEARPALRLLVRAHPAGGWLDRRASTFDAAGNVTLQSGAEARTAPGVGPAASMARRVITTPSTVALDAAMCGRPVALALPGGPAYASLPVLDRAEDWAAFANAPASPGGAEAALLAQHLAPGDAAATIVAHIGAHLSRR